MAAYDRRALLAAVLARLGEHAQLAVLQREIYADSIEEWLTTKLKSPKGGLLVSYAGSRRSLGGEGTAPVAFALDIVVVARATGESAEAIIEAVEAQLDGHRLALSSGTAFDLAVESDAFTAEGDRLFVYTVRCRADVL